MLAKETVEALKVVLSDAGAENQYRRFEQKAIEEVNSRYPKAPAEKKSAMVDAILIGYLFGAAEMCEFFSSGAI